jgi:membrane dipeptidase
MNLFDLHCDTATEAFDKNKTLSAFSLPLLKSPYQKWAQVFAIYISDTKKADAITYFEGAFEYLQNELLKYTDVTPIFAVENCGNMVKIPNGDIAMLKVRGVRIVSLTHNGDNPLCGGIRGDGRGLSALGKEVVSALSLNGITLDCSHCSDRAFWEICESTDGVFIATHSNSRSVCGDMRNLTDEQVKEIFRRGGLVGLNFYGAFSGEKNPIEALIAHIERFFILGGEKYLAIGSDYDGATIAKELFDLKKVAKQIAKTFGQQAADGIFYENAARFFGLLP